MSKRNVILLIIVLVIIAVVVFGVLYFTKPDPKNPSDNGEGTNFLADFNPFGTSTTVPPNTTPPSDVSGFEPSDNSGSTNLQLTKVSSMPVAGFGIYSKERYTDVPEIIPSATDTPTPPPTEFVPAVRYVDKVTGNIYQTFADKIEERKFSTTTIPAIHEAFFGNNGESVVMRYLKGGSKTIETFVGNLPKELLGADSAGENEVTGSFLPENISDISLSPDSSRIFYLFGSGESAIGATYEFSTTKKVQVFDSPFTEWLSGWPNENAITLTTKPSANFPGYAYIVNPNKKDLTSILRGINGLTALGSPDGQLVLFANNNLSLGIYHTETRVSDTLGARTLPEKCVWGSASDVIFCAVPKYIPNGEYPDSWYRGEMSFGDQIWRIDVASGVASAILDPAVIPGGEEVDATKLALDTGGNYLFFVNKKDSFLWKVNLK